MTEERTYDDADAAAQWAQSVGLFDAPPRYAPVSVTTLVGDNFLLTIDEAYIHISRVTPGGQVKPAESIMLEGLVLCRRIE